MSEVQNDGQNDGQNKDSRDIWNGEAGEDWARYQRDLDLFLGEATETLLVQLPLRDGAHVLEIGSGAGSLSLRMGRVVGETGRVLGLDVSEQLIALARRRVAEAGAGNIAFRDLDIQTQPLDETGFDICTARVGMMFFADPALAFARIRDRLKPGAVIAFNAWARDGNPWFSLPMQVAERHLGPLPESPWDGPPQPGPMAFCDVDHVTDLLQQAGYGAIMGRELDITIRHPDGMEPLMESIAYVGPTSTLYRLKQPDEAMRKRIAEETRAAFSKYITPDGALAMPGHMTIYRAVAP